MGDSTLVIRKGMLLFPSCPLVRESIFCSGFSLPESGKVSKYVNNRLGGFLHEAVAEKPNCALIGEDGNIFNLMGIAARTLRENGMEDKAEEMKKRSACTPLHILI